MKVRNAAPGRPERIMRGLASTLRSTGRGITLRDNGVDVEPVWDIIAGQGLKVTDLDDGLARLDAIGGTGPDGGQTGSGSIVEMLNNSGQDLLPGAVVVVDETADKAVTVTTTEGDTRIVGVVQEPIGIDDVGLVLFNGYAPVINAPTAVRGEYAKTATTATQATSTADREAGSFAVYLTGNDFPEFVSYELTTTAEVPTSSLDIEMPPSIPVGRVLFLALWLTDDASSVSVPDWTLIGSESGFYYYTKLSEGDDSAAASWTGASVAVATVLLLSPTVHPGLPVQDFDYENTGAAAEVTGLSDAPRYAIAGVKGDVASPGGGFVRLGGGTAGFAAGGSTALVQSNDGDGGTGGTSFDSNPTVGNFIVAVPWVDASGLPSVIDLYDPRDPGTCPAATSPWVAQANFFGSTTGGAAAAFYTKVADEAYAGPYKNTAACTADAARATLTLLEFSGVSEVAAVLSQDDVQNNTIDLGTFSGYGADDVIVMAVPFKIDGGGDPGVSFAAEGFTQIIDDAFQMSSAFRWLGYKIGGTANAKVTHSGGASYNWGAAAIHLTAGSSGVAGTLAGKYIGHDSSATSPFTVDDDDAIFAFNLMADAKPSALLYGPDLLGADDVGGPEAVVDHGDMGSTETLDITAGTWHRGTLDDDCTITVSGFAVDEGLVAIFEVTQDGGFGITWDADVEFIGEDQPDQTASTVTVFLLFSSAGDSTIYGVRVGQPSAETAGHFEVLMDGGSPPEPLEDGSGTDWLYVFVP